MTSTAYDAPIAPAGRDLRMTLTIKAFAPGDEILCRLIDRAVEEIQVGTMYVGKSVLLMGEGRSYVRVAMTDYQQTWDGETAEELDRKERALALAGLGDHERQGINAERPPSWTPPK